ncbi:MAG: hypothetical protein K2J97_04415 [Muribaculaceae bacterium]|nr:hypothetical protein [Muribaculaceae bacterium]
MKKLLLAVALVGTLSLGSCIDNNESASVTAVRNAKAEQLKGLANLANAQAEAATIEANADAALKQAQAEYQKAQAEYIAAQTAPEEARTEAEKANAQAAQANAMIAMANAQEQVKQIAAQGEIELLNLKTQALKAQAEYEKALLSHANQNIDEITQLYNTYQSYSQQLLSAQQSLAKAKVILAQHQAQIITNAQFRDAQIAEKNKEIGTLELNIAAAKEQIEILTETTSSDAKPAYEAAKADLKNLQQKSIAANDDAATAVTAQENARYTLRNSEYIQNIRELINASQDLFPFFPIDFIYDDKDDDGNPTAAENNWCAIVTDLNGDNPSYIPLFTASGWYERKLSYEPLPGMDSQEISYLEYAFNHDPIPGGLNAYKDAIATFIEEITSQYGDDDNLKAAAETINEIIKKIDETADDNVANMKAYNDASLAWAKAEVARIQAESAVTEKQKEVEALEIVLNDIIEAENKITSLKNDINNYNQQITDLKKQIIALENSTDDDELIANQEATINNLEKQIAVLEKQLATAKATLEAAINAGSEE